MSAPRAGAIFECRDESADDKGAPDEGVAKENSVLYLSEALGLATMVLWLYCLFDAITTPEEACRNLPKILWVLVVLLFPLVGSVIWLVAGRPQAVQAARPTGFPEYDRPGPATATNPDDDEEFLRRLRERAEEQRKNAPKPPDEDA
ncbi:PLDc N-terminal domain-containing protein [Nonomuraea sp. NEAU-A123]|uniref:PLDc N-terminal domain-containing protein n=1 Tax=Nonomuraea sp. NEAU-A123 TaxID=2839649 RepID=UPI0020323CB7|nr:PLDc N-terminal domain-containing protein [Nonomuraea sp. NEAU-A123]